MNDRTNKGADAVLAAARRDYERCREAWRDNQAQAREDLRFAKLGEQWPAKIASERDSEERPCLTFNKLPAFIRQVVNDARLNKPAIRVHPQDSGADKRTAEILNGLIRNIETSSDADVAYDTAIDHAVGQGFGFWRINSVYAADDAFDQALAIERIANPFTVLGDPRSTAADSSDWNVAFVVTSLSRDDFERDYPEAEKTDWDHDYRDCPEWIDGEEVTVAEYWTRETVRSEIVALSDGTVRKVKEVERLSAELNAAGIAPIGEPRAVESFKVTQRILSGAELLREVDWAGQYIPIVPVYGDEVIDETGRRHFRSLIRDAKSAQEMFNYWRTATTEMVALAPKAPFIAEDGALDVDGAEVEKWHSANRQSHAYLLYRSGYAAPQRQPFSGVPAGALQEALNAADDIKSIIGLHDASLGARSNETSGRAIMARQREGDVSTFHFIDNLSRAIRHSGRILLDLIPRVYGSDRIVRVLGEDLTPRSVRIAPTGVAVSEAEGPEGALSAIYDLGAGRYDLTVKAGPSFTTRREEAALQMESLLQKVPGAAQLIGDLYAEALDWPMADRIAERLRSQMPPEAQGDGTEAAQAEIARLQGEVAALLAQAQDKAEERVLRQNELALKARELAIKGYEAATKRLEVGRGG